MTKRSIIKRGIGLALVLVGVCWIAFVVLRPSRDLAHIDYGNGSWLRVEKVTFGTNHVWSRGGWNRVKERGFLHTCWSALRNLSLPQQKTPFSTAYGFP